MLRRVLALAVITLGSLGLLQGSASADVQNLQPSSTASTVTLTWDDTPLATSYEVHRVGGGTAVYTVPAANTHTSSNLQPSTNYTFHVSAYSGPVGPGHVLIESEEIVVLTKSTVRTPTASRLSETSTSITFKWTQTNGANHWYVSRVGGGSGVLRTVRQHTSNGLQPNTVYTFRVRAAAGTGVNEVVSPAETINIRTKP